MRRAIRSGPLKDPRIQAEISTARLAGHECLPFIAATTVIWNVGKVTFGWTNPTLKGTAEDKSVAYWKLLDLPHRRDHRSSDDFRRIDFWEQVARNCSGLFFNHRLKHWLSRRNLNHGFHRQPRRRGCRGRPSFHVAHDGGNASRIFLPRQPTATGQHSQNQQTSQPDYAHCRSRFANFPACQPPSHKRQNPLPFTPPGTSCMPVPHLFLTFVMFIVSGQLLFSIFQAQPELWETSLKWPQNKRSRQSLQIAETFFIWLEALEGTQNRALRGRQAKRHSRRIAQPEPTGVPR